MLQHQPDGHGALYALHMLSGCRFVLASARCQPDGGVVLPASGTKPGEPSKGTVSSARTMMRFMAANSFTLHGSVRRVSAWSDRVTGLCVQRAGCDGNKKTPGGKGKMKFRCVGHMRARAEAGRRSLPLHHDTWCGFSVTLLNYYVITV